MPMTTCQECKQPVSSRAESCPHCGCPLTAAPDVVSGRQVRTVERTAKRFKGHILVSTLLLLVGVFWIVGSCSTLGAEHISPWAVLLVFVAAVWLFVAKLSAWWHHG